MRIRSFKWLVKPTSLNIIPSSISVKMWTTYKIPYTLLPENTTNQKINWYSSDTSIATVSNWIITTVAVGTATITGTTDYLWFTDTVSIEVYVVPVTWVSLNKSSLELNAWETFQLIATITPADAWEQWVTWYSSNTSVATVSSSWLVTFIWDGNCTVTATTVDWWYTASCSVECISFAPVDTCFWYTWTVQSITLKPHQYCFEVRWAEWWCSIFHWNCWWKWWYSSWKYNVNSQQTFYIYVWGKWNTWIKWFYWWRNWWWWVLNLNCYQCETNNLWSWWWATDIATLNCPMGTDSYYRYTRDNNSYNSRIIVAWGWWWAEDAAWWAWWWTIWCWWNWWTQNYAWWCTIDNYPQYYCFTSWWKWYWSTVSWWHHNHAMAAPWWWWYYWWGSRWCVSKSYVSHWSWWSWYIWWVTSWITCDWEHSFPSPSWWTETWHSGNGCVRIRSL